MIIDEKERCYSDYLHKTQLNKKASEILRKYYRFNKTVLVTNCRKDRALETLKYHGLLYKFSGLFFKQLYERCTKINKYQNAILSLNISPRLVIAFENEPSEIIDARDAGIQYINPLN